MCIAAPAQIVEINDNVAIVDFGGVRQNAKLDLVEDVDVGRYVLVHSGYAIEVLSDQEAKESLEAWEELLKVMEEEENEWLIFFILYFSHSIYKLSKNELEKSIKYWNNYASAPLFNTNISPETPIKPKIINNNTNNTVSIFYTLFFN